MATRAYIRTCEECGQPHTYCKEDQDGLMVCEDCQKGALLVQVDDTTSMITTHKAQRDRGECEDCGNSVRSCVCIELEAIFGPK